MCLEKGGTRFGGGVRQGVFDDLRVPPGLEGRGWLRPRLHQQDAVHRMDAGERSSRTAQNGAERALGWGFY